MHHVKVEYAAFCKKPGKNFDIKVEYAVGTRAFCKKLCKNFATWERFLGSCAYPYTVRKHNTTCRRQIPLGAAEYHLPQANTTAH